MSNLKGYLDIAKETHYPITESQLGYCYLEEIGTSNDFICSKRRQTNIYLYKK